MLILLPLSPTLIFGLGPLPAFGVAGAATAVLLYYAGGSLCFALYLWGGGGILRPSAWPPRLSWAPFHEILRVGGMSALVSATTNLTIAIVTSYVGTAGVAALAGYGAGARLEFILVSLSYGISGPAGILIGTNIGAGQGGRALRTAWITVLLSALATEAIGLAAATWPVAWIGSFSGDPVVLAIGTTFLPDPLGRSSDFSGSATRSTAPGKEQGAWDGRLSARITRAAIAVVGGAAAIRLGASLDHIFMAVSLGMTSFGLFSLPGLFLRLGYGTRQRSSAGRGQTAVCTR